MGDSSIWRSGRRRGHSNRLEEEYQRGRKKPGECGILEATILESVSCRGGHNHPCLSGCQVICGLTLNFIFIFLEEFIYLFLERGREAEREGEKHRCVVTSHTHPPHRVPSLQPRHAP